MVPNRPDKSPAPGWETLQDHGATDSSEAEGGYHSRAPPHRQAAKPPLKRKDSDRAATAASVKRPKFDNSISKAGQTQQSKAGPSRPAAPAAPATQPRDSPDPQARLLKYADSISVSKPRRIIESISASAGKPMHQQEQARVRPRPRPVLNSTQSASQHLPPPADAMIIDISSGDDGPAPVKKKAPSMKKVSTARKRASLPAQASTSTRTSAVEIIEILDSDEEKAREAPKNKSNVSSKAKGKARAMSPTAEGSDASMASATDMHPPSRPRTPVKPSKIEIVTPKMRPSASAPTSPRYTPLTKAQTTPASLRRYVPLYGQQVAVKSTSSSRPAVTVSPLPLATDKASNLPHEESDSDSVSGSGSPSAKKAGGKSDGISSPSPISKDKRRKPRRHIVDSDSDSDAHPVDKVASQSTAVSSPVSIAKGKLRQPTYNESDSGSNSHFMMKVTGKGEAPSSDIGPDTRSLSDALGLSNPKMQFSESSKGKQPSILGRDNRIVASNRAGFRVAIPPTTVSGPSKVVDDQIDLPTDSEAPSSEAGYDQIVQGSQVLVNRFNQIRRERSSTSVHLGSPGELPSPPPVSPTPPLETPSTPPRSPSLGERPPLSQVRRKSAPSHQDPSNTAVDAQNSGPGLLSHVEKVSPKHRRPISISSMPQHALQEPGLTPLHDFRSPENFPIWPPPPQPLAESGTEVTASNSSPPIVLIKEAAAGLALLQTEDTLNDAHMMSEVDAADPNPDESSGTDMVISTDDGEVQDVMEVSQSLAAAPISGGLPEEPNEDRGEGPSRGMTRSTSMSSPGPDEIPVTLPVDEGADIEKSSHEYADSGDESDRTPHTGKTLGGFPALNWKDYRKDLRNFTPKTLYAKDIPRALHDHINHLSLHTKMMSGMREVYQAMIQENTVDDEPDAPPVLIQNPVDEEPTPAWEFYYTNKIYHGENVPDPDIASLVSCNCRGGCNPRLKSCACLKRQRDACGDQNLEFAYDKNGRLRKPGYPIYECNDLCGCGDECRNRVVQQGRKVGIAIRKTQFKGWGVFATQKIFKGQFIGIYSGELLTDREAHERGVKYNKWGKTYLFDIDFHHLKDPEDKEWNNKYTVDAYHCGNFTRFLNHSCDPNSRLYPCYVNEGDIQKPLLAIFSRRDIEANEEICFNYTGSYPGDDDDEDDEEQITEQVAKERDLIYEKCMCGAANCTGVMFK